MSRESRIPCLLIVVAMLMFRTAVAEELPEWTSMIREDHPRLFFNNETWPSARQRAMGPDESAWLTLKASVDRGLVALDPDSEPRDLGVDAAKAAFVFLVTDDDRYLDLARTSLETSLDYYERCYEERKSVNWYSTSRVHAICAWDWLYNDLSLEERARLLTRLVNVIDNVLQAQPTIYRENMSGYNTGFYGVRNCLWFLGCTGHGTGIEAERIDRWLVWGREENLKLLEHRRRACGDDGGGASATLGYVFGAYPWAEQNFFYTWLSSTGENIAPDWPHSAWLANYVIWNWIEAKPVPMQFGYGDTPHTTNDLPISQLYTHMANVRHLFGRSAPDAAALARHIQEILPSRHARHSGRWFIYPFLMSEAESSPPSISPDRLPSARHFENMGQVFMRSGTGPDDTHCLFTCGGTLAQHRHFDSLNFVLYHRGFLALDSGTRYDEFVNGRHLANYFAQTVAHNCVVIRQEGEPPARYWGGTVEGNHGGQHRQLGSTLQAFYPGKTFVYAAGDATACYQHGQADLGEKCELATRQLVFLMPDILIVCDRVVATRPEYRKTWLLHTANEPTIEGKVFLADHEQGRMFCRALLPADAVLSVVGGPGEEFLAAGENWDIVAPDLTEDARAMMGRWRIEVQPGDQRTKDVFLHVLQVGDQTLDVMISTELIESDGQCGVTLTQGTTQWTVTFNTEDDLGGRIIRRGEDPLNMPLENVIAPQQGVMGGEQ